jgi:hypothetical protein
MNPNTTWSGSLKSYHPYLVPQKVPKNSHTFLIYSNMPKKQKANFWPKRALGVKWLVD